MIEDKLQAQFARDRENAVRAESEARALEAEFARMRKFLPPDLLAERRRVERENEAAAKLEAELEMAAMERAIAAHRERPPTVPEAPARKPWVTSWREPQ